VAPKAIARGAGLKALHDEEQEFADTRAKLADGDRLAGWLTPSRAFCSRARSMGFVVVALGLNGRAWVSSIAGAVAALIVVIAAGLVLQAPLPSCA